MQKDKQFIYFTAIKGNFHQIENLCEVCRHDINKHNESKKIIATFSSYRCDTASCAVVPLRQLRRSRPALGVQPPGTPVPAGLPLVAPLPPGAAVLVARE